MTKSEFKDIQSIGGVYTIVGKPIDWQSQNEVVPNTPTIFSATHINFNETDHEWKGCYIVDDYHAKTFEEATEKVVSTLARQKQEKISNQKYGENLQKKYGFQDSLKVGNCETGTLNFIRNTKLDKLKKYKGEFLLELASRYNVKSFVERMLRSN